MKSQPASFGLTMGIMAGINCGQFLEAEIKRQKQTPNSILYSLYSF